MATAGLDAYMFIRVCNFGRDVFVLLSFIGIAVLMPEFSQGAFQLESLESISMANIMPGEHLFVVILMCYFFSAYTLYLLRALYRDFITHRLEYLKCSYKQGLELSLMIQNIPEGGAHFAHKTLERAFPEAHDFVQYVDIQNIDKLLEKKQEILQSFESAKDERAKQVARNRLSRIQQEIANTKVKIRPMPVAFASFSNPRTIVTALHTRLTASDPFSYTMTSAFHPCELYLPNLRLTTNQRLTASLFVSVLGWVSVLFWIIPVSIIGSFANIEVLVEFFPFLSSLVAHWPLTAKFVGGLLPGMVLSVSLALMPMVFWGLSILAGHESQSRLQQSVFKFQFNFIIFNCFLVLTISGSILKSLKQMLASPVNVAVFLGRSLPDVSMFFMSFIIFQTLTTFPMRLLSVPYLIQGTFVKLWERKPSRALLRSLASECDYGSEYPTLLLVFVIGFTYACISPIVAPACLLFFFVAGIFKRYQFVYMFAPVFQTGGQFWPLVYDKIIICMVVGQLTWIGVVLLKQSTISLVLLVPLPCITLFVAERLKSSYEGMADSLPADYIEPKPPTAKGEGGGGGGGGVTAGTWECPHGRKLGEETHQRVQGLYKQGILDDLGFHSSLVTERSPLLGGNVNYYSDEKNI